MKMRTLGSDRDGRLILVPVAVSDAAMDAIYSPLFAYPPLGELAKESL